MFEAITGLFRQAVKALTDAPTPKTKRSGEDDKGRGGMWRLAARRFAINFRRTAREAFAHGKAATAPEFPHWLREFFEADSGPNNLCDPSNPDRDLVLGTNDGAAFDAGSDISGPSLDLG